MIDVLYSLDTNTCIDLLKGKSSDLIQHYREKPPSSIRLPSLVVAELLLGAELSRDPPKNRQLIEKFIAPLRIIDFDAHAAQIYATMRADLQKRGQVIGPNDMIIAATTMVHHSVLITSNIKEFQHIQGLKVENWLE